MSAVVVAVIVTELGVLVGRRRDQCPPWTFLGGKIEPGESPAQAAVREVLEEAGLAIVAGAELGRRIHPMTGATIVYVEAAALGDTRIHPAEGDQIAEVRWVATLDKLQQLIPPGQLFAPVRRHLERALPRP